MSKPFLKFRSFPGLKRFLLSLIFAAACTYLLSKLYLPNEIVLMDTNTKSGEFNTLS